MKTNLHKLREMIPDPKNELNEHRLYDDETYMEMLEQKGLLPFNEWQESQLKILKRIRLDVYYAVAGDDELIRRLQESVSERGDWDIQKHIRWLEFDISSTARKDLYG